MPWIHYRCMVLFTSGHECEFPLALQILLYVHSLCKNVEHVLPFQGDSGVPGLPGVMVSAKTLLLLTF